MSAALVKEIFGASTSLYDVLGCDKAATAEQIKRAYYKKALQWHPDKAGDDSEATKKFQALGFIHSILSDDTKRKAYDRKGKLEDVEEEGDSEAAEAWYDYWRTFFPVVTQEDLVKFEDEYRESEEERLDVLKAYTLCEGDVDDMLDNIMCSRVEDVDRFVSIVHKAIQAGEVEAYDTFTDMYGDGSGATDTAGASSSSPGARSKTGAKGKRGLKFGQKAKPSSSSAAGSGQPTRRGLAAAKRAQTARESRAAAEAAEAEEMLAEMRSEYQKKQQASASGTGWKGAGAGSSSSSSSAPPSLTDMIRARQAERAGGRGSIEALIAKYGGGADDEELEEQEDEEDGSGRGARGGALGGAGGSGKGKGKGNKAPSKGGKLALKDYADADAMDTDSPARGAGAAKRKR